MRENAIKKIKESEHKYHGPELANPIAEFVIGKCEEDEEFAALVMQEHKTLLKCLDFIVEQAKKHLNGKAGYIPPEEVYAMANDYFAMDDAALEAKKAEADAKREEESKKRDAEQKSAKAEKDAEKKADAKKKSVEKKQADGQMSLF